MERILVIGLSSDHGGIENYILNLYEHVDHTKMQFDFLVKEELCEDFKRRIDKLGGEVFVAGTFKQNALRVWNRLKDFYKERRYQKIYVNMSYAPALIYVVPALKNGLKKIYVHSHASDDIRKFRHFLFRYIFYNIVFRNIPMVYMGCSTEACIWQFGKKISRNNELMVINNAIDYNRFCYNSRNRYEVRNKYNIPQDAMVLGHVGRFSAEKNHYFLLELFKQVYSKNRNAFLLLVGDGALREEIRLKAKDECLIDNIVFVGAVSDTSQYYSAMDCFLLPSLYEGLPMVVIEAQINGLKCFISDKVTKKVNVLEHCEFFDISSISSIEESIYKLDSGYDRSVSRNQLIAKGYDLENEVKKIQHLLLD